MVWMVMVWEAVLGGFGLDFSRYVQEIRPPPTVLHVHATVYVLWLLLGSVQILLVETGNIRLHMRLGWATAIVSAAMVPLGFVAAMVEQVRQIHQPDYAPQFLRWSSKNSSPSQRSLSRTWPPAKTLPGTNH